MYMFNILFYEEGTWKWWQIIDSILRYLKRLAFYLFSETVTKGQKLLEKLNLVIKLNKLSEKKLSIRVKW